MIAFAWMGLVLLAFVVGLVAGSIVTIIGIESERKFEEEELGGRG